MNVLTCATCGRRLTEPVRRLDEMPAHPGRDGLPGPGGRSAISQVCGCGAEVAVVAAGRAGGHETRLGPDAAVRGEAAA
ncbi:hypothetical protein ACFY30_25820 [Streptomyces sp. NPDC000345]|uniref:hypothetical protein n=1 Tax=Streptomyces sp. NPDC000345 TaxID=3364537 RepID=UPI0036B73CD2